MSSLPSAWTMTTPLFHDRRDAGRRLASVFRHMALHDPLVLGIPHGGVAVAAEVSRLLGTLLDVWVCEQVGGHQGTAPPVAAVSEGGGIVWAPMAHVTGGGVRHLHLEAQRALHDVVSTADRLRSGRPRPCVRGRDVVLVDDGLTTSLIMRAALLDLRLLGANRVVIAVPVGDADALNALAMDVTDVVCLAPVYRLRDVSTCYGMWSELDDNAVVALLHAARRRAA